MHRRDPDRRRDQPRQLRRRAGQRRRRGDRHQQRDRHRRAPTAPGQQSQSGNIGVGFAIPANTAKRIAKELIETGKATHAFLGRERRAPRPTTRTPASAPARRSSRSQPGTAAADAGLKAGDVVTAVGDRPVTTSTELTAAVRSKAPGDKVTLTVRRGNDSSKVDVTLDAATDWDAP